MEVFDVVAPDYVIEGSIILVDKEGLQVAVPLTPSAAAWWSRGTDWYTAAGEYDDLRNYEAAPLFIICCEYGNFQLYADGKMFKFVDANNREVRPALYRKLVAELPKLMVWIADYRGCLEHVSEEDLTPDFLVARANKEGFNFRSIPKNLLSEELCVRLVAANSMLISRIPEEFKTSSLWMAYAAASRFNLPMSRDQLTMDIARAVLAGNGRFLDGFPSEYKTVELVEISLKTYGYNLWLIPSNLRTLSHCIDAIKSNSYNSFHFPKCWVDRELVSLMARHGRNFATIYREYPAEMSELGPEILEVGLNQDGGAIHDLPVEILTAKLCLIAVRNAPWAVKYVPDHLRDRKFLDEAFQVNAQTLDFMNEADRELIGREPTAKVVVEPKWLADDALVASLSTAFPEVNQENWRSR